MKLLCTEKQQCIHEIFISVKVRTEVKTQPVNSYYSVNMYHSSPQAVYVQSHGFCIWQLKDTNSFSLVRIIQSMLHALFNVSIESSCC